MSRSVPDRWPLGTVLAGLLLLSLSERRFAILLSVTVAVVELVQLVGMILVVPVVSLLVDESLLSSSASLARVAALLGNPPVNQFVLGFSGGALLLIVCGHMGAFAVQAATEIFAARAQTRLVGEVLSECVETPYPWFLDRNAATLVRLFQSDFAIWGREFVGNLLGVLSNIITIGFGVVLVLTVAPLQGLLAMIAIAVIAILSLRLVKPRIVYWTAQKRIAADRSMVASSEMLTGIKDVIASGAGRHFVLNSVSRFGEMSRASARGVIYSAFPAMSLLMFAQAGLLLILLALWYGGSRGGELAAQAALMLLVVSRLVPSLSRLSSAATRVTNAVPWVAGVLDLRESLAAARRVPTAQGMLDVPADWPSICFENVSFAYKPGEQPALDKISVELRQPGCYGLMGLSGSGKTTFVDLLLGLLRPAAGRILVGKVSLVDINIARWRAQVGYVSQSPFFLDATLRANITFGASADDDWLRRCITMAGLDEFVSGLPQGLDAALGDRAVTISGGQKQRIAIARALYRKPRILVLDESTAALDALTESLIVETLAQLKADMLILIVSHRRSTLAACDYVFELSDGAVKLCEIAKNSAFDAIPA